MLEFEMAHVHHEGHATGITHQTGQLALGLDGCDHHLSWSPTIPLRPSSVGSQLTEPWLQLPSQLQAPASSARMPHVLDPAWAERCLLLSFGLTHAQMLLMMAVRPGAGAESCPLLSLLGLTHAQMLPMTAAGLGDQCWR